MADDSVRSEIGRLGLVGARLEGELRLLDVEAGQRAGERARGFRSLTTVQELQLDTHKLHSEEKPYPDFGYQGLEAKKVYRKGIIMIVLYRCI